MKKVLSVILALTFIFTAFAMTACGDKTEGDGTDTTPATNAPDTKAPETDAKTEAPESTEPATDPVDTEPAGDEPNMYPYTAEIIPASIEWDWGAPDATSVYFPVDVDHVIHDGKGTWNNTMTCTGEYAFDMDSDTFYDCDELCEYANVDDAAYGISGDWTAEQTGYVGAWIESGVVISQIRFFPRVGDATINARPTGCKFQGSVDGETWVDLYEITEQPSGGDFEFYDIDDETVYYYVRFLSREVTDTVLAAYCNIAEFEIWGTPGK